MIQEDLVFRYLRTKFSKERFLNLGPEPFDENLVKNIFIHH